MIFFSLGKHIKIKVTVWEKTEASKIFVNFFNSIERNKVDLEARIILICVVQYLFSILIVVDDVRQ